jgi:hypothetical protein
MPSEHLAAPAAVEADNIIAVNGATDRHRGCSLDFSFGRRFAAADERLMHGRNQRPELVRPNLVSTYIGGDNLGREFSVDRGGWLFFGHHASPFPTAR